MLTLLLYSRWNPLTLTIFIIGMIACGLVFWFTKGIAFGYGKSKLSEKAKSTIGVFHILVSLILAMALPNNYLSSSPFLKSLYDSNDWWIPASMFILFVFFITTFGLLITAVFRPMDSSMVRTNHAESSDKTYVHYRARITTLLFVATGALIYWALSGFSGKFNDRMSRYYEDDNKFDRNYWVGFGFLILLITSIVKIIELSL